MRLLGVPATSAPCKHIFRLTNNIISDSRNSLESSNAGDLIFLHDSNDILKENEIKEVVE